MDERLDTVERGLEAVARLTAATAKGQGKERTQRLVVVLATGVFRGRVTALVDEWNKGAEAARAGAGASAGAGPSGGGDGRPPPLKFQLWTAVASQLAAQGLEDPVRTTLDATPPSAIEATYIKPAQDSDRPLVFTVLFRNNLEGLNARAALASNAVGKVVGKSQDGTWPPCGLKAGRFTPGSLHRAVLEDCLGHSPEEVNAYFKGKGGKGGKGTPPGLGPLGGSKRGAAQRLSVAAPREAQRAKR